MFLDLIKLTTINKLGNHLKNDKTLPCLYMYIINTTRFLFLLIWLNLSCKYQPLNYSRWSIPLKLFKRFGLWPFFSNGNTCTSAYAPLIMVSSNLISSDVGTITYISIVTDIYAVLKHFMQKLIKKMMSTCDRLMFTCNIIMSTFEVIC